MTRLQKPMSAGERNELLALLQSRFTHNRERHPDLEWTDVSARLEASTEKLWSLQQMERTGGEPDVVRWPGKRTREIHFVDCSEQSPAGRYSLCYDQAALASRKKFKPENSAMALAASMGITLIDEEKYFALQQLGEFDTRSSSWLLTPPEIRNRGGAIFGDRRFGRVFVYHNGAESYYSGRGFRGTLCV